MRWFKRAKEEMDTSEWGRAMRGPVMDARAWREPVDDIWEVRGGPQHFVHSKVMTWAVFDRAVSLVAAEGLNEEEAARWREIADEIHADVCGRGFDCVLNSLVQAYGSKRLDASLLLISLGGRLLAHSKCVGLLAEEIDPVTGRTLGNLPRALSHVGVIICALKLSRRAGPVKARAEAQAPFHAAA